MQSELFAAAWGSDASLAVSAPTGSGKTVVFELALLRLLSSVARCVDPVTGAFTRRPGRVKAVYVAPMRVRCGCVCARSVRAKRVRACVHPLHASC
jgi:ATP-dependent DNA helicase HFM1/MER3